jgi:hypothetical protein
MGAPGFRAGVRRAEAGVTRQTLYRHWPTRTGHPHWPTRLLLPAGLILAGGAGTGPA